jgi:hypothetical protein
VSGTFAVNFVGQVTANGGKWRHQKTKLHYENASS